MAQARHALRWHLVDECAVAQAGLALRAVVVWAEARGVVVALALARRCVSVAAPPAAFSASSWSADDLAEADAEAEASAASRANSSARPSADEPPAKKAKPAASAPAKSKVVAMPLKKGQKTMMGFFVKPKV